MMTRIFQLFAAILFSASLSLQASEIPLYWNFDWDDNIMFMPTKIIVFNKETGAEKGIATDEFALVREQIGKSGEFANYELDPARSYRNFREAETNHFLKDLSYALENQEPEKWKAPAYEAFIDSLKTPETAANVKIITARGHSPAEIYAGIEKVIAYEKATRGHDLFMPDIANLHGVTWPGYGDGTSAANPSAAKAKIMQEQLKEINEKPIDSTVRIVRSSDGHFEKKLRLWGFSDDDWGNYEKAVKVLGRDVKAGKYPNVKIVLRFTGHNHPTEHMQTKVIMPNGELRDLKPDEIDDSKEILGEIFPSIYRPTVMSRSCLDDMLSLSQH